ncbi:hypothetical protein TWF481_010237 [Arthrobotrys musiformis]|uniref:Uncharacterized protein n=1 Tax=Arthrobotrys musiformis TaxID=47236 RepID=A0AAV9W1K2_9PEZI
MESESEESVKEEEEEESDEEEDFRPAPNARAAATARKGRRVSAPARQISARVEAALTPQPRRSDRRRTIAGTLVETVTEGSVKKRRSRVKK